MAQMQGRGPVGTPRGDPIMASKFRLPAIRQQVVRRDRLLDLLSEGVRGPLTLISAPAGTGKSLLATSWVSEGRAPGPQVWISLDEDDDSPGVFWTYILAGLARGGVPVDDISPPEDPDSVDRSLLVRLAACLSEAADPVVLILDNAEVLNLQGIADELDFLLRHAGGRLGLVLITRVDPNLPLHQYRLDGSLVEIRFPELAFTTDEAAELLRGHHAEVTESGVLAFAYRTKGWAAGLRLGSVDLERPADPTLGESDIAAYFRAEVLEAQPPQVRDFLLSTCVVDHLSARLAMHLSGVRDAATTLRMLAQANTFVEACDDEDDCYEYHPLVRDLLRAELRREPGGRSRRLHRRAANWLSAAGRVNEALRQYVAASDWPDAARLVVNDWPVGHLLAVPPSDETVAVLVGMPVTTPGPEAALVFAMLAWRDRKTMECEKYLARVDELLAQVSEETNLTPLKLGIAVTSSVLACSCGDVDGTLSAATTVQQLQSALAARGVAPAAPTHAVTLWATGSAHLGLGDFRTARQILAAAARTANVSGYQHFRARCLADLALTEALSGRLARASDTAQRAITVSERLEPSTASRPVAADVALAWVDAERGDSARARARAEAVAASLLVAPDASVAAVVRLVRSRLLRARGDHAGALAALSEGRATSSMRASDWFTRRLDVAEADLLIVQEQREAASRLLRERGAVTTSEGVLAYGWAELPAHPVAAMRAAQQVLGQPDAALDVRVGALLLAAACDLVASRLEPARASVDAALDLAEPEGSRRCLEEAPAQLRSVIRERRHSRGTGRPAAGPDQRAVTVSSGQRDRPHLVQPLTERETEVLGYLADLLPTEEIAGRMFVSVNTVKTHIRAILRKLAVERRNEAVRRARDLGLL
jgi:LuxR family maltose regulon positive regulatory protein